MARPAIVIDVEKFEELCGILCTEEEIAGIFHCSVDTIERWCRKHYRASFAESYKKLSAPGKASLRRMQFKMAASEPAMAIWLGKQLLGQRENPPEKSEAKEDPGVSSLTTFLKERKVDGVTEDGQDDE